MWKQWQLIQEINQMSVVFKMQVTFTPLADSIKAKFKIDFFKILLEVIKSIKTFLQCNFKVTTDYLPSSEWQNF